MRASGRLGGRELLGVSAMFTVLSQRLQCKQHSCTSMGHGVLAVKTLTETIGRPDGGAAVLTALMSMGVPLCLGPGLRANDPSSVAEAARADTVAARFLLLTCVAINV